MMPGYHKLKPHFVVWKEGRNLERIRQISFEDDFQARSFCQTLIRDNKPYRRYSLVEENWY